LEGERAELEAYLAGDFPKCTPTLAKARWAAAQTKLAAPKAQTWAALRDKIMDTVKTPAQASRTPAPGKNSTSSAHATIFPAWAWIAAVALALVTGYTIRRMNNQNDQLAQLRKQMKLAMMQNQSLQNQLDMNRMVAMIIMSPDSMPLKLLPKDKDLPAIRTYLHPHMGMAITADEMPPMPATRTLQLWFAAKTGKLVSVAIFHPDAARQIALVAPVTIPLNEIAALSVTDEPAGGSPQPTSAVAWTTKIN
jgi:hypothetical protein